MCDTMPWAQHLDMGYFMEHWACLTYCAKPGTPLDACVHMDTWVSLYGHTHTSEHLPLTQRVLDHHAREPGGNIAAMLS